MAVAKPSCLVLLAAACAGARSGPPATPADAVGLVGRITTLKEGGARLDWIPDHIAFDMRGADGFFDVYSMRPDGTGTRCLTCDHPDLPQRHVGQPAWHPAGRYLVVQAEKRRHEIVRFRHQVTPGAGRMNDLWVLDLQAGQATLIREVRDAPGRGTLHAHFSADGRRLSWTELQGKGAGWALMVADFRVDDGRPRLVNVQSFSPGGRGFYENHGFSPDGTRLIYTSDVDSKLLHLADIYALDLRTEKATRLASQGYNEHALYSPDGRYIAWMATVGNRGGGTDYWIMNADGSNKRRLTYFNQKGHPHYAGKKVIVADLAWRPDGTAFAGYYREGGPVEAKSDRTRIILVELRLEGRAAGDAGPLGRPFLLDFQEASRYIHTLNQPCELAQARGGPFRCRRSLRSLQKRGSQPGAEDVPSGRGATGKPALPGQPRSPAFQPALDRDGVSAAGSHDPGHARGSRIFRAMCCSRGVLGRGRGREMRGQG